MLNIAICDDNIYQLTITKDFLVKSSKESNIFINIITFSTPHNLIDFLDSNNYFFDIIYLDILMPEINGIDTAKLIRNYDSYVKIIITSTSKEYLLDGYDICASNYLIKPYDYTYFKNEFINISDSILNSKSNFITIKFKNKNHKIFVSDIIFFESKLRKVIIHTIQGEQINYYERLDLIIKNPKIKNFIRTHKSFLVNSDYIFCIDSTTLTCENNIVIPISRSYKADVKKSFMNYISTKM